MKKVFLTDDDFYQTANGLQVRGGSKIMYDAHLVVKLGKDGGYEVIKDRFGLSKEELEKEIYGPDERLLLMA